MTETWNPIPSTDGRYEASSSGCVRAMWQPDTGRKKIPAGDSGGYLIASYIGDRGYPVVRLDLGSSVVVEWSVASCVLTAFVGPRPSKLHRASYLDGDKTNVHLSNLKWLDPKQNGDLRKSLGHSRQRPSRIVGGILQYQCNDCREWLPEKGFYRLKGGKSRLGNPLTACGLHSECRQCTNRKRAERRAEYGDDGVPSLLEQILPLLELLDGERVPLDELERARPGERIAAARMSRGLSRAALARQAGLHPETLSQIEEGRNVPRPATLRKLLAVLRPERAAEMPERAAERERR
jgi:DNA-binding XRE family transcriptional regulator